MGNEIFSERVKAERAKRNLTQDALAEKLGVTKSRVAMWETNGAVPRQDVLLRLCALFKISADYLLGNDASARRNPREKEIHSIQRCLQKLDSNDLQKAKRLLKAAFDKTF